MKLIEDIEKEKYEEFVKNHPKSHFLQSYAWGEFAKSEKNLIPHYVGLIDDNEKLVATALLLEKKLPLGFSYLYCLLNVEFYLYSVVDNNYLYALFYNPRKTVEGF